MKRIIGILLIAAMLLSGCASKKEGGKTAVAGEYIEGGQSETTPDQIVPNTSAGGQEESDPSKGEAPKEETSTGETPKEETSTGETPKDETPKGEIPKEESPEGETPEEEIPEKEEENEAPVEYDEANRLKIISYNVRYTDDEGGNSIDERAPRLKTVLDKYDADLVGMQEVVPRWVAHIQNDYSAEYTVTYKYRSVSNSEGTLILWRTGKFELLDEGYFWLSETPEKESKGWDANLWRICNWVKLKVKSTGKVFLFYNTHYDGGENWQYNASEVMLEYMRKQGGFTKYPIFLTGDFNMLAWTHGYLSLTLLGELENVNEALELDRTATTNGYNNGDNERIIDFVFYSPGKAVPLKYQVLNEKSHGGYVSDHRGLYTEVAIL